MINRPYMFFVGVALLTGLYLEIQALVYVVIGLLLFQGVTNVGIVPLFRPDPDADCGGNPVHAPHWFIINADRAAQLIMGLVLLVSYGLLYAQLWFLPWFVGFAITGAGLSGVCPLWASLKLAGLK